MSGTDLNGRAVAGRIGVWWYSYDTVRVKSQLGFVSVAESATVNTVINAGVIGGSKFIFGGSSQYYEA